MYYMHQWMLDTVGPSWGWFMLVSMAVFTVLILVILVLLVIWLMKQIGKK